MQVRDIEYLKRNDNYVYGDATRFSSYERGDHLAERKDPATLLLMARNLQHDFSSQNTDALLEELRTEIGQDGSKLALIDFDRVGGEVRNLWGNNTARLLLNERNGAAVKVQGLIDKYEDRKEKSFNESWIIAQMRQALKYDYTELYGSQKNTLRVLLEFVRMQVAARYRTLYQTQRWDPLETRPAISIHRYGKDCSWQLHTGLLILDAVICKSGNFYLSSDPEDISQIRQADIDNRRSAHYQLFFRLYRFTVDEAMNMRTALEDEKANLADIFAWLVDYINKYVEWYCMTVYDWVVQNVKQYGGEKLRPISTAYRNLVSDIKLAMNQREQFRGITQHIYNRIIERVNTHTDAVRNITDISYNSNGELRTVRLGYTRWAERYGNRPRFNFPSLGPMPLLAPESRASNVPPELDGRAPNIDRNDDRAGDAGDDDDGGESDSHDSLLQGDGRNDSSDDGDGGGGGPSGGGANRRGGGGGAGRGGRGGGGDRGGRGGGANRDSRGGGAGRGGRGDRGGGGGTGDTGGGARRRRRGRGRDRRRRSGGGGVSDSLDSGGHQDQSRLCVACPHLSGELVCPLCGGGTLALWQNKRSGPEGDDDELASPSKRLKTILDAQAVVDDLRDQLQGARIDLSTGRFHSTETISSDYPDSFKQKGPEFDGLDGPQEWFQSYRLGYPEYPE